MNAANDATCPAAAPHSLARSEWATLLGVLLAMMGCHAGLAAAMPGLESCEASYSAELFPGMSLLTKPAITAARVAGGASLRQTATIGYLVALAGLFAGYAIALRILRRGSSGQVEGFVIVGGLLLMLVQMVTPVMLSTDVISYIEHGRAIAIHGYDPTSTPHPLAKDDPFLVLMDGNYPIWPYGPLWTIVSTALAKVGGDRVGLTICLFRVLAVLAMLGGALAIWGRLRARIPAQTALGLAFLLWNPLVTIEAGGGAHIDTLMVGCLLLAFAWQGQGKTGRVMAALALSALVKYVTVVLVPMFLVAELMPVRDWAERKRIVGRSVVGLILPAVLCFGVQFSLIKHRPGITGFGSLFQLTVGQDYINNWHELALPSVRHALGDPPELVDMPASFAGWWVSPRVAGSLRSGPADTAPATFAVAPSDPLLVVGVAASDWLVVQGRGDRCGYLANEATRTIDRPDWVDADPDFALWEWSPSTTKMARTASRLLRGINLALFTLVWGVALLRVYRGGDLATNASVVLLAVCYLLGGWYWPWYTLWPIATAALNPRSRPALLTVLLSAGTLTLYATIGSAPDVEKYRSLLAFGLPLVLFATLLPFSRRGLA